MFKSFISVALTAIFIVGAIAGSRYLFAANNKRAPASYDNLLNGFSPRPELITRVTEATQRWPFYTEGVSKNPQYPCGTAPECRRKNLRKSEMLRISLASFQEDLTKNNATDETLADLNNFFIAQWCDRDVFHSVCGTDPYNHSKIFKLTSYRDGGRGSRDLLQPESGATGLLLLTSSGQFVRIYFNSKVSGKKFGEGNTGLIYQNGQGLNSIQNVTIALRGSVYRDGEVISNENLGQLYIHWSDNDLDAHIFWWEHNVITYNSRILTISMARDSFEEKWEETSFDELSPVAQRAISSGGPGFQALW